MRSSRHKKTAYSRSKTERYGLSCTASPLAPCAPQPGPQCARLRAMPGLRQCRGCDDVRRL